MKYICIKCRVFWVDGVNRDSISGGVCESCITDYIRTRQIEKGFEDCFRRNTELCSKKECDYWEICNRYYLENNSSVYGKKRETTRGCSPKDPKEDS